MINFNMLHNVRNLHLINKSGLFDKNYYRNEYPDVTINPLKHYYYEGYKKGYNPSLKFDNDYYLRRNLDVKSADVNPLLHYIVSGRNEGRRIKDVTGISISSLYEKLTNNNYVYSVRLSNYKETRVSLLIKDNFKCNSFIIKIIAKCNDEKKKCRIIYENIDFNLFNEECNKKNINLDNVSFCKYDRDYILDISVDELFVCIDFDILLSLLNTPYILNSIYFGITNLDDLSEKELMWLSLFSYNGRVICVGNDNIKFNKYLLVSEGSINCLNKKDISIHFDFDDFSINMLMIFQYYFLTHLLDKSVSFSYNSDKYFKNISFDNDKTIVYSNDKSNWDIAIRFGYSEKKLDNSIINVFFKKTNENIELKKIDDLSFNNYTKVNYNYYLDLNIDDNKVGDTNV